MTTHSGYKKMLFSSVYTLFESELTAEIIYSTDSVWYRCQLYLNQEIKLRPKQRPELQAIGPRDRLYERWKVLAIHRIGFSAAEETAKKNWHQRYWTQEIKSSIILKAERFYKLLDIFRKFNKSTIRWIVHLSYNHIRRYLHVDRYTWSYTNNYNRKYNERNSLTASLKQTCLNSSIFSFNLISKASFLAVSAVIICVTSVDTPLSPGKTNIHIQMINSHAKQTKIKQSK